MEFDFEKTQRTVWQVNDRIVFLEQMRPLLNLNNDDVNDIKDQLQERDFDYLEIASYFFGGQHEEPSAALVFDSKKDVYWDIFDTRKSKQIIKKITELALQTAHMQHQRGLTQRDWKKRLKAIYGFDITDLAQL